MKKLLLILFLFFVTISCGNKEEIKFEAFSPEAFAYDIGEAWEVNATVNVRGFEKTLKGDNITGSLSYNVDMISPDGDVIKNIYTDLKELTEEELNYMQLEVQFELDTTYREGSYQLVFNIVDNNSGDSTKSSVEFELSE